MSEGAAFIPAKTLLQYQSPLSRLSAENGAKLLRYQSSVLRLWADTAPWPWFQYQSSWLRLWAGACEFVARNYGNGFALFSSATEPFGMPHPKTREEDRARAHEHSKHHNRPLGQDRESRSSDEKPIIDMNGVATENAGRLAEAPKKFAGYQPKTAATKQKVTGANARKKIARAVSARKKLAKKASKAPAKKGRK